MQATDFGDRDDRADFRRLNRPSVGCIFVEREVSARPVIVREVTGQDASSPVSGSSPTQMSGGPAVMTKRMRSVPLPRRKTSNPAPLNLPGRPPGARRPEGA
jgi:hypothetical protein